jgi:hypothetical protein
MGHGRVWLAVPRASLEWSPSIVLYRIDPSTDSIERVFDLRRGPAKASSPGPGGPVENVAVDDDATWITDELAFQVVRVGDRAFARRAAREILRPTIARVDLGAIPIGQPLDFGALWTVAVNQRNRTLHLLRIDRNGNTVRRVSEGMGEPKLLAASDSLWVAGCPRPEPTGNCLYGTVDRIDPHTGRVTARVRVGDNITALAATEDAVWVGQWKYVNNDPQPAMLLRIDPRTLTVRRYSLERLRTNRVPCCIHMLAAAYDSVWMLLGDESQVVRMDVETGRFTRVEAYGSQIASDGDAVWLVGRTELDRRTVDHLFRIDVQTSKVTAPGPAAASVAVNAGSVWALQSSVFQTDRTVGVVAVDSTTGQAVSQPLTLEAGPHKVNFGESVPFSWTVHGANGTWGGEVWLTVGDSLEAIRLQFGN